MTREDLHRLVAEVRRQAELDSVEVKAAQGGTPRRLYASLSAFANRVGGGVLLFGLDERSGFSIVGVGDMHRLQEEITHLASADMEPALRPQFVVDEVEGKPVVAVEVEEVQAAQKPCYFKPAGLPKGAYWRVGNTNRQMTEYEVFGFLSGREQPRHDEEVVPGASLDDLNGRLLDEYQEKMRRVRPGASFQDGPREQVLARLHVVAQDGEALRPTLGGLLMFGTYPQEFLPQLMVTFVQYYGTTEEEPTPKGERFLDSRRFEGPIPEMLDAVERHIYASMRKSALIEGMRRRDVPEYPGEALREAMGNAVAHRDYSPYTRGSYIQVRMFADRLEVQSPGGLFGNVTVENLEEEQSTRNARLMRMMEDMHIVENRGSGIRAMLQAMRAANLEPPRFDDRRTSFWVTFHNHTLMNPEAIAWLNRFSQHSINDRQRLTLVYLQQHAQITNSDYRRLNHVDAQAAREDLRGLVQAGLVEQNGASRWTYYTLKATDEEVAPDTDEGRILAYVQEQGSINNAQCRELLGVDEAHAYYLLNKFVEGRILCPQGSGRWRIYVLA